MPEGLGRFGDKLVLGVCVAASLYGLSLDESARIELATRWAHSITTPVEWGLQVLGDLAALKKENEALRVRIASLELDASQIAAERDHLEELEQRAGFYERHRGRLAPAAVLELIVNRIPVQAKIRSFGADSLRLWQPVVTAKGLVGRIRQLLAPDRALVQLLTDQESRISVEVVETGLLALLRYDGRNFLLDHVPQGQELQAGDRVRTSGLGGTVPRGIPVGTVAAVRRSPRELFQQVEVKPAVRFSALTHVYVVTRPGPWYSRRGDSPAGGAADADDAAGTSVPKRSSRTPGGHSR